MTETTIWVRAWKCKDCGHIWWGEWRGGKPFDLAFCKKCGGEVILGAAAKESDGLAVNAPFKPANATVVATSQTFVCSHCGAPTTVTETP
jgi:hypothetical protein